MLVLADDKILARDHEVTCLVLEDSAEAAVETSLAENFHRLAMNPADEAQAFAALVAGGATVEDVARRFGLTVRFAEGRLRLATLAPIVFEALASGQITLDIAKAFGATSDQEIQARVFEQVSSAYYAPNPDSIRRMVLSGTVPDRRYRPIDEAALGIARLVIVPRHLADDRLDHGKAVEPVVFIARRPGIVDHREGVQREARRQCELDEAAALEFEAQEPVAAFGEFGIGDTCCCSWVPAATRRPAGFRPTSPNSSRNSSASCQRPSNAFLGTRCTT